eukprot:37256-Eustigmatos_ZCMA.PRE.1
MWEDTLATVRPYVGVVIYGLCVDVGADAWTGYRSIGSQVSSAHHRHSMCTHTYDSHKPVCVYRQQ